MIRIVPTSAIVATGDRPNSLARTLKSLAVQDVLPAELIIIDGSTKNTQGSLVGQDAPDRFSKTVRVWQTASRLGAAPQRNQGMAIATQPFIWFFDDDVVFEPRCVERLWDAISSDRQFGGVNAMIINQHYQSPGFLSRSLFTLMHGQRESSFAGKVIGPAVNLLPEDIDSLPEVVAMEWLNTTCTMYRREALPSPPFDSVFTGYSLGEDLALSLRVGRKWKLANARTARIFHDSQAGLHKADVSAMAEMEFVNRHYVMTKIMGKRRVSDYARLLIYESFVLTSSLTSVRGWMEFPRRLLGKIVGIISSAGCRE